MRKGSRRNPHVFYQWKRGDTDRPLKFYVAKRFYSEPQGKRKAYYVIRVKGTKGDVAEHWTKAAANKDAARRNKAERKRRKKVWASKFGGRFATNPRHRSRRRRKNRKLGYHDGKSWSRLMAKYRKRAARKRKKNSRRRRRRR